MQKGMEQRFFHLLAEPLFKRRVSLLGIFHHKEKRFYFNPKPSDFFEEGDVAIVLANPVLIHEFKSKLHRRGV